MDRGTGRWSPELMELRGVEGKGEETLGRGQAHYGTKLGHFETSKNHFPTSEEVSKRANERAAEGASEVSSPEQVKE